MSDPKQASQTPSQPQGPPNPQEDKELTDFLIKEHGHTQQSAEQEVKHNREGVKHKKKVHDEQHKR